MRRALRPAVLAALWALALAGCSSAPATAPPAATPPAAAPAAAAPAAPAAAPAAAPRPAAPKLVPPTIPGFKLKEPPVTYGPDNLYEFIDGAADFFLAFDFQELTAFTYAHTSKAEVSVEVYRQRDPERAYGVYAGERSATSRPVPIGVEGHGGRDYFLFVIGSTYVKLTLAKSEDFKVLAAVAEGLEKALPGTREAPPVLKCFPTAGRILRGEKLAARDFLGRGFLHDAIAVPYEAGGAKFRLFAIRGRDAADARDMIARYEAVAGRRDVRPGTAGSTTVKDPVNGSVILHWNGRWVWGAVDNPPPAAAPLLGQLGMWLVSKQPEPTRR